MLSKCLALLAALIAFSANASAEVSRYCNGAYVQNPNYPYERLYPNGESVKNPNYPYEDRYPNGHYLKNPNYPYEISWPTDEAMKSPNYPYSIQYPNGQYVKNPNYPYEVVYPNGQHVKDPSYPYDCKFQNGAVMTPCRDVVSATSSFPGGRLRLQLERNTPSFGEIELQFTDGSVTTFVTLTVDANFSNASIDNVDAECN